MKYDFDQIIDRSRNHSAKYDERKKKFGTDDVIPLWIADMDFKTAQPIIDALKARAEEGIWGYTARPDSYFEAIRGWQKRRNGWDIDPSLMSFSLGVVQSISAMVKLFTPEGGSVLIQTPVYSEFYDMTEAWNRRVLENPFVEKDGRWEMDWADFEAKLAEAVHAELYLQAYNNIDAADDDSYFLCPGCGYIEKGSAAPEKCPICGAPAKVFKQF